jgi:ATP-binding cassette, subfamily B, bacterial
VSDEKERKREQQAVARGTVRILWPFIRQERLALVVAGAATGVLVLAELAAPWPFAYALDQLIFVDGRTPRIEPLGWDDVDKLAILGGAVLVIALVGALATYQSDLRLLLAGERIIHELRLATYAQLQRLRISFHHRTPTGDLVTRVTADQDAIGDTFANSLGKVVAAGLLLIGYIVVTLLLDPLMVLVAFSVTPFLALFSAWFRRRQRTASRKQRKREGEVASLSGEVLAAMREVQAFGSEEYEQARLRAKSEERRRAGIESATIEARFSGVIDVTGALAVALVLTVGVWRVRSGYITPGELVVVATYAGRLYRPLSTMAKQGSKISKTLARGDRIAEILAADEVLEERPNAYRGGRATGEIQLDRVVFGYTPERVALHDVSFLVPAGQRVAIIGRSGAGKSTVAALIARFYDPQDGSVLIDGRDVRDCSLSWLRTQVGVVLQESVLFTGTIAENIAYGIEDADPQAVAEAAKAAGAHDFISQMPEGYDAMLGQRGVGLSGGQRQRIAIARMFLRNPSILVLDEPTTGLDAHSEAEVMQGLEMLMAGRTTIMITHSPALTGTADRVIEIGDGRIVRQGSPDQLAAELRQIRRAEAQQAATVRRAGPPPDAALPQMPRLLDPEEMAPVLHRSLGWDAPLPKVRVRYLRYKPRKDLVVHYDVTIGDAAHDAVAIIAARHDLSRWAAEPTFRQLADMVDGRAPALEPLSYAPEIDAMIQWLPLDISLPALAQDPVQLRLRLQEAGVSIAASGADAHLLAYKPRRRAVLRLDGHVVKIYGGQVEFAGAVIGLEASSRIAALRIPGREAVLPELQLTSQALLDGRPPAAGDGPLRAAGSVLATLHRSQAQGLRPFTPVDQLKAAVGSVGTVVAVVPELEERLQALKRTLEATMPDPRPLVPVHGDFHANQLLESDGALAVIDFDEMCAAPAALDFSSYAAHLINGDVDDLEAANVALDGLAQGYGGRPRAVSWFLATSILRRSPFPFRFMEPEWPRRIESMVAAAEEALHL